MVSATGKALPQATGFSGGYPAGTQHDVLLRGSNVKKMLAEGCIPGSLEDLDGTIDVSATDAARKALRGMRAAVALN